MKKKTVFYIIIGIFLLFAAIFTTTFAYWNVSHNQEKENFVNSACLKLSFNDKNNINIDNGFPINEEKGKVQAPYTFTITNECNSGTHYVINLETVTTSEKKLKEEYLRGYLTKNDNEEILFNDTLKDEFINTNKVIKESSKAIKLYEGDLRFKGNSQTFNLRLWLDETVEAPDSMNATYEGKITITATYKKVELTAIDTLQQLALSKPEELVYDKTDDNNLRFVGSNPDNYINFNNDLYKTDIYIGHQEGHQVENNISTYYKYFPSLEECNADPIYNFECKKIHSAGDSMWRIIGVMNNIEDENGTMSSHLKIIRDDIGSYSWDSTDEEINGGYGVNEWSTSYMQKALNNEFYQKQSGAICYRTGKKVVIDCPKWESIGLDDEARSMVSKVKWHTGTFASHNKTEWTPIAMYKAEKSENDGKKCSSDSIYCTDKTPRTTIWPGYIGLMYPSDYGYATSISNCLNITLSTWNNNNECYLNDWLYSDNRQQWTMTPIPVNYGATRVFDLLIAGHITDDGADFAAQIRPVLYLESKLKIIDGNGSNEKPFILELSS